MNTNYQHTLLSVWCITIITNCCLIVVSLFDLLLVFYIEFSRYDFIY